MKERIGASGQCSLCSLILVIGCRCCCCRFSDNTCCRLLGTGEVEVCIWFVAVSCYCVCVRCRVESLLSLPLQSRHFAGVIIVVVLFVVRRMSVVVYSCLRRQPRRRGSLPSCGVVRSPARCCLRFERVLAIELRLLWLLEFAVCLLPMLVAPVAAVCR